MQELLFVSTMTLGDEVQVRTLHDDFPYDALGPDSGVERVRAFIGSGFYALEITVQDGDVQENLHRFLGLPEVDGFFGSLRAHVQTLPRPDQGTADMPLAAPLLDWRLGSTG